MNHDLPHRVFRKGTINDIPKFHPVEELLKAGRYAKFGHVEITSGNEFYQSTNNLNLDKCLAVLKGEMTSSQVAEAVGSSQSAAYKWLTKLGDMGKVDRRKTKVDGFHTIVFWKI